MRSRRTKSHAFGPEFTGSPLAVCSIARPFSPDGGKRQRRPGGGGGGGEGGEVRGWKFLENFAAVVHAER